jgi:hypothetical protein
MGNFGEDMALTHFLAFARLPALTQNGRCLSYLSGMQ